MANTIETNKVTHKEPCTLNMSVERCFLEVELDASLPMNTLLIVVVVL
jgi:hypothetical protein